MNTDTGRIYGSPAAILGAIARGEPVVPVSREVALAVQAGRRQMTARERSLAKHRRRHRQRKDQAQRDARQ